MKNHLQNVSEGSCVKISYIDNNEVYTKIAKIIQISSKEITFKTLNSKQICAKNDIKKIKVLNADLITIEDIKQYQKKDAIDIIFLDGEEEVSVNAVIEKITDDYIRFSTKTNEYKCSLDEIIEIKKESAKKTISKMGKKVVQFMFVILVAIVIVNTMDKNTKEQEIKNSCFHSLKNDSMFWREEIYSWEFEKDPKTGNLSKMILYTKYRDQFGVLEKKKLQCTFVPVEDSFFSIIEFYKP